MEENADVDVSTWTRGPGVDVNFSVTFISTDTINAFNVSMVIVFLSNMNQM